MPQINVEIKKSQNVLDALARQEALETLESIATTDQLSLLSELARKKGALEKLQMHKNKILMFL